MTGELAFYGYGGVIRPWLPGLDGSTLKSSWDFRIFRDFRIFSLRTTIRYYLPGPQLRLQHDGCTTLQLLFPWQFFSCICSIDDTAQSRHPQHPTHVDRPWRKHSLRPLSFCTPTLVFHGPVQGPQDRFLVVSLGHWESQRRYLQLLLHISLHNADIYQNREGATACKTPYQY